jgi:multidrug efflux pump subunit AcrB
VFFSLLVARLVTPMLAAYFFRRHHHEGPGFRRLLGRYVLILAPLAGLAVGALFALAALPGAATTNGLANLLRPLAAELPPVSFDQAGEAGMAIAIGAAIVAVLFAYINRPHPAEQRDGPLMRAYTGFLGFTVRFRWVTLAVGIGLFVLSIQAIGLLPTGFIPKEDASRIVVSVELPPGSTLETTRAVTDRAAASLRELPEVRSVLVIGGSSPTGTLEVRRAAMTVNLTRKFERTRTQGDLEPIVTAKLAEIPDLRSYFVNDRGDRELSVGILGADGAAVSEAAAALESEMRRDPIFANPSAMASFARPEIRIRPRLDEAADLGIAPEAISQTVRVATIGDADANLAKFNVGTRQVPIRVQLEETAREDLEAIRGLRVGTASGASVPLDAVAEISFGQGPSTIDRYDRERLVKVGTAMAPGHEIGEGSQHIMAGEAVKGFPAGVRIQEVGDAEIQAEVFTGFASAMAAGIMMVLVVLILLFGSVFLPITILASLPLSVGGVVGALLITQNAVSMPVVIGILMLMGIVTKNSIMLVDFAVEQEKHGMPQREAIIDAGRKRARPIIMTTLAMAAGMVPAAMASGEGGEFRAPMAIAVIGGLLVSTVLSLVFIPSLYTLMDDLGRLVGRIFRRLVKPNRADDEADRRGHGGHGETRDPAPAAPEADELSWKRVTEFSSRGASTMRPAAE